MVDSRVDQYMGDMLIGKLTHGKTRSRQGPHVGLEKILVKLRPLP
jgi:hypothetical protein